VHHINEGHAALLTIRLLERQLDGRGSWELREEDCDAVRRQAIFTTHTPVPAGHDRFPLDMVRQVLGAPRVTMLEAARALAAGPPPAFETCTRVPPNQPDAPVVCMPQAPELRIGGAGQSGDPFGGNAFRCQPTNDPVLGCHPMLPAATDVVDDAVDMETAAVAQVAHQNGVPWSALRVMSDSADESFDLRGVMGFGVSTAADLFESIIQSVVDEL
jgi:hypothetical protein